MPLILKSNAQYADVILIGAGIMSATLGVLLKTLQPDLKIIIIERLDRVAGESSDAWNNAGTGHSALCELNYTPELEDGSVDVSKAFKIYEAFQKSLQFWTYLTENKVITNPAEFIKAIPHMSFVKGEDDINYLKKRFVALKSSVAFSDMSFLENHSDIKNLLPLMMAGRNTTEKVAATLETHGTDVNFGKLTTLLINYLKSLPDVKIRLNHEVQNINKLEDGNWSITMDNLASKKVNRKKLFANFVFIGAGGGALPILEKSDIEEAEGYGGFPVSGQWLRCINPEIIAQHNAKVYGKAAVGAPPMSVPHLDTRYINGKKELLFGPFAGFTTKFLKEGSLLDLPTSITFNNIIPMLQVGLHNFDLTRYLLEQVIQSPEDRLDSLQEYYPNAQMEDWELLVAGQRVQIIKKDGSKGGVLEFGTEIVSSADGSIAALLGASPGASTAVDVMLKLIAKCFPELFASKEWQAKLLEMIPTFGKKIIDDPALLKNTQLHCRKALGLNGTE
jgi:malate dehydrogenase (quinone)